MRSGSTPPNSFLDRPPWEVNVPRGSGDDIMRKNTHNFSYYRARGTILVLSAILLVALMGFVALAIDLGMMAAARAQLQTVADAAALAGARQLASDRRISTSIADLAPEMSAARAKAIAIGQSNSVLNQAAVVKDNPDNTSSGDVVIGYLDPKNASSAFSTAAAQTSFNSVRVTAIRSSDHVGVVPALFSGVLGFS